jgi:hypothetical protein
MEWSLFRRANNQQYSALRGSIGVASYRPFDVAESGDLNLIGCTHLWPYLGCKLVVHDLINGDSMEQFLLGATTMGFLVAGLFFLRFWWQTHDRLFAMFALAFWALGLNRLVFALLIGADEARSLPVYIVRLLAFSLILVAILDKNRSK